MSQRERKVLTSHWKIWRDAHKAGERAIFQLTPEQCRNAIYAAARLNKPLRLT